MGYLLDTSILVRLTNTLDISFSIAARAVLELHRRRETVYITGQNIVEFWNVATRPEKVNGLGLSPSVVEARIAAFESAFPLLADTPDIYPAWRRIVTALGVVGKQVHDARLVAVCHAHGMTDLLTFNTSHFLRLSGYGPAVRIVDPASL